MALILEDGTGKSDAQSVASAADVRAYAAQRGLTVPSSGPEGDGQIEQKLVLAMDWLQTQKCYKGNPSEEDQSLPFPRDNVQVGSTIYPDNYMPTLFKRAQIVLAIEALKGTNLMPTISGSAADYVVREKVGPIETEYADATKFSGISTFTEAESLLQPLVGESCNSGFFFTTYRA